MSTSVVRRCEAEWALVVVEWRRSGKTKRAFAAERGINANTLGWWCVEVARRERERAGARFAEVVMTEPSASPPLVVEVVGRGVNVHVPSGFDALELRRLVGALC
jgi:hypothetical protein